VIYDNNSSTESLKAEWGFACLVKLADTALLFDTGGDGSVLMANMAAMGIDPKAFDIVVLSHEHWDHVGGLTDFLAESDSITVYMPRSFSDKLKADARVSGAKITEISEPAEICASVFSTGEMGTRIVEQSLVVRTPKGSILITGCAHPGIVDIVEKAKEIVEGEVLLVMGGFHLLEHSESQIVSIVKRFRELGVRYAGPCHCSGDEARELFRKEYGEHFVDIAAGKIISLEGMR
jgi:7,8-dihydropterin-6-yl-methyl-4-(beta-D-ribofuranosyl)aminobenzene 5'-phosphate synthase